MKTKRINVWSSPRNVSTALMYSFAQRSDTTIVDEPLYAHYLAKTSSRVLHPGKEDVLQSQENDGEKVIRDVIFGNYPTPVVFFKQMSHHLIGISTDFLNRTENVLLIRDPKAILASYIKVIPNPTMQDIGIRQQYELFQALSKAGSLRAVVDAKELLLDPPSVLSQLCDRLDIPFERNMLRWKAGPRPEDGVWARYWYATVHSSTGFQPYAEQEILLPEAVIPLAEECRPYYDELYEQSLKSKKAAS